LSSVDEDEEDREENTSVTEKNGELDESVTEKEEESLTPKKVV